MRSKILIKLSSSLMSSFFMMLGIHNYKKDPSDNFSLASIIFWAVLIGFNLGTLAMQYVQHKKENPPNKYDFTKL